MKIFGYFTTFIVMALCCWNLIDGWPVSRAEIVRI